MTERMELAATQPPSTAGTPGIDGPGEQLGAGTLLAAATPAGMSPWSDSWRRFRRNKLAMVGLVIIVLLIITAVFAPLIARQDPGASSGLYRKPPSLEHWFGTDSSGRDVFSRVVYGSRVSLTVGVSAAIIATIVGVALGAVAGFYGGIVDSILMRVTDILLAFPYFILAVAIISVIGRGQIPVILVLGLLGWLAIARVLRSNFLQLKQMEFMEAARALGASHRRLILRHLLPNAIQPVIVYSTLFIGTAVLSEAALSFVGQGITEPTPSWGLMVNTGKNYVTSAPHLLFFPGAAIFIMVLSFLFVGDGLRDALDPKLR